MAQDFSKGKIYKITNDYNDDVYIGSTCDTLVKRFSAHKSAANVKEKQNVPLYKLMKEIGTERFCIYLIEDYPCTNKYELRQQEGYHIRELATLNKKIEGRDKKEYYNDNAEKIVEYQKQYRIDNAEKIAAKKKQYHIDNTEKIQQYQKQYHKQYKIDNAEKIAAQQKQYQIDNAEKIAARKKEAYQNKKQL